MKPMMLLVGGLVLVTLSLMSLAARADDAPPVFDKRAYAEAKKGAEAEKKWFIVKGTAEWCGPCKQMDKTTWRDEKVVAWLKERAVVVALDVDQEAKLAKELGIEAMPTMIAFKDGKEFDRVVGRQGPAEFLVWLEGIAKGEKSIDAVKKKAGAQPEGKGNPGDADMQTRLSLAEELGRAGKFDEAGDEFVWLWKNMLKHQESMYGVRLSFMAGSMERLAKQNAGVKKKFVALRDETGKRLEGEKVDREDVVDWVVLNKIVGDRKATLAWYDKVKDDAKWNRMVERVNRDLLELFVAEKRWADIGRATKDPMEYIEREHELYTMTSGHNPKGVDPETVARLEEMGAARFRESAATVYAGLLAAGREADANLYCERARLLDTKPGMARTLVEKALEADQPRKSQVGWLEEAAIQDAKLKETVKALRAAIEKKGK